MPGRLGAEGHRAGRAHRIVGAAPANLLLTGGERASPGR